MSPAEAAALLTVAAAYDNRKPDADAARAWALVLDGIRFEDAREAVVNHYRTSREWMMPVDVIRAVKKLRTARLAAYGTPEPPPHIDPDDTGAMTAWLADTRRAIADGEISRDAAPEPLGVTRKASEQQLKEIRAGLHRRTPDPDRPDFATLAAPAAEKDRAKVAAVTTTEEQS